MMTDDRLTTLEDAAKNLLTTNSWWSTAVFDLANEIRRLQQRERDLQTAVQLNEGLLDEAMKDNWPKFIRGSERNDR